MRRIKVIMGMTVKIEIVDLHVTSSIFDAVIDYFSYIDATFSTYKPESEISRINRGELLPKEYSRDMKAVFALSEKTKQDTDGFFDITRNDGSYDPSGLVKGWAIYNAAEMIKSAGYHNFYVDAGGDVQVSGKNAQSKKWAIGIKNPFTTKEIVKVMYLHGSEGVATSGTYERGEHIYNPKARDTHLSEIVSLTVIGPNIFEADRCATAAFAMGKDGLVWLEHKKGFEGYAIDVHGVATMTSGFESYTKE